MFKALPDPDPPMSPVFAVKITVVPVTMPPVLLIELPCNVTELVATVPTPAVLPIFKLPAATKEIVVPPIAPLPLVDMSPVVVVTCKVLATEVLVELIDRA